MEIEFIRPAKARSFKNSDQWMFEIDHRKEWPKVIAEIKRNGWRYYASRDYCLSAGNKKYNFEWIQDLIPENMILDGEIAFEDLSRSSGDVTHALAENILDGLYYYVFDVLYHPDYGYDVMKLSFIKRRELIDPIISSIETLKGLKSKLRVNQMMLSGIPQFLSELKNQNGEGIIFKYVDRPCVPGSRANMIKYKFREDYDVVITDADAYPSKYRVKPMMTGKDGIFYENGKFTEPWLLQHKNLRYGLYDAKTNELKVLGSLGLTGPKEELEQHIGKVARVRANQQFQSGCLQHPVFIDWRDFADKRPTDCRFDFEKGVQV